MITLLTEPAATPPVELWRPTLNAGLPTLLDHAPVTWRHPAQRARWELAAATLRGFRETLDAAGFTEIQTPKFVASATESGANVFEVDYFGRPAYLAQSPQFYKQQLVGVFERVYEVGPVFRAEPHDTVRHLAEYVSLDVELGFIGDHRDVLAVLREVIAGMVAGVHEHAGAAVERTGATSRWCRSEIPVIHFRDALALVGAPEDEPDLAPEHERALGAWAPGRARQRLRRGRGLPDGEAALLHPPLAGRPALVQQLRPDLPRARAGHGRAAAAPARRPTTPRSGRAARTRRRTRRTSRRSGTACRRTAGSRSGWSGGRAGSTGAANVRRGDAVPARPEPAHALT